MENAEALKPMYAAKASVARLMCGTIIILALIAESGCGNGNSDSAQSTHRGSAAEEVWIRAESQYKTNDLKTAYPYILGARNHLAEMRQAGKGGLDYDYCLAILNGRLFLMAKNLGLTTESKAFLTESSYDWNQVRKELQLAPTNYSAEDIEKMIKMWDSQKRPSEADNIPHFSKPANPESTNDNK